MRLSEPLPLLPVRFVNAGSVVGLGGAAQQEMLRGLQAAGSLGCFLLTEMQAGVLSGLIVETTAEWVPAAQEFVLHTPSDKAAKNWISQVGRCAGLDWPRRQAAVVSQQ